MIKELRKCKQCGEDFSPCKKTSEFCSKSCATKYRNRMKLLDGSHNFLTMTSEERSNNIKKLVENGTHPLFIWEYE